MPVDASIVYMESKACVSQHAPEWLSRIALWALVAFFQFLESLNPPFAFRFAGTVVPGQFIGLFYVGWILLVAKLPGSSSGSNHRLPSPIRRHLPILRRWTDFSIDSFPQARTESATVSFLLDVLVIIVVVVSVPIPAFVLDADQRDSRIQLPQKDCRIEKDHN
jgi:hypothetical protein